MFVFDKLIVILRLNMGATKSEIFSAEQNQLALLLKAMAHPARIAILQHLISTNACICGDLVDELGLAQATISQHLKELKNAGIIKGNIEGVKVCYCINPVIWEVIRTRLSVFLNAYNSTDNCC